MKIVIICCVIVCCIVVILSVCLLFYFLFRCVCLWSYGRKELKDNRIKAINNFNRYIECLEKSGIYYKK